MAVETDSQINDRLVEIRDETAPEGNSKLRIYNAFKNIYDTLKGGVKKLRDASGTLIPPDANGVVQLPDYVLQSGAVFYHNKPKFIPLGTVSTVGTTVTAATDDQFGDNPATFPGSKIVINGESRIVVSATTPKILEVNAPFSEDYVNVSAANWRLYWRAFEISPNGDLVFFTHQGFAAKFDVFGFSAGNFIENGVRLEDKYAPIGGGGGGGTAKQVVYLQTDPEGYTTSRIGYVEGLVSDVTERRSASDGSTISSGTFTYSYRVSTSSTWTNGVELADLKTALLNTSDPSRVVEVKATNTTSAVPATAILTIE